MSIRSVFFFGAERIALLTSSKKSSGVLKGIRFGVRMFVDVVAICLVNCAGVMLPVGGLRLGLPPFSASAAMRVTFVFGACDNLLNFCSMHVRLLCCTVRLMSLSIYLNSSFAAGHEYFEVFLYALERCVESQSKL